MEQRTKDLGGMIGQVRGFDLDQFLSDWEPSQEALPWAIGDSGWVGKDQPTPSTPSTKKVGHQSVGAIHVDRYRLVA